MILKGFQKLTTLDFPEKLAATVFTFGCDFRCPFCHNASLVLQDDGERVSEEEILAHLEKRRGVLEGLAITGGEPLLHPDLPRFLEKVKALGFPVKLDTNGYHPDRLQAVLEAGLVDYVAMDLKNCREKYPLTCGLRELDTEKIDQSIRLLLAGKVPYEFRTTLVAELHTAEDIQKAGEWIRGAEQWFLQCFKDSGDLIDGGLHAPADDTIRQMLEIARPFVKRAEVRGVDLEG